MEARPVKFVIMEETWDGDVDTGDAPPRLFDSKRRAEKHLKLAQEADPNTVFYVARIEEAV